MKNITLVVGLVLAVSTLIVGGCAPPAAESAAAPAGAAVEVAGLDVVPVREGDAVAREVVGFALDNAGGRDAVNDFAFNGRGGKGREREGE